MSWCTGSESQLSRSLAHRLSPSPAASESPVPWGILADSQPGCRWRSGSVYSGGDWIKTRAAQWQDKQPPPGRVNSPKAGLGCVNQSPSRLTSFRITDPLGGLQQTVSINSFKNKKKIWCLKPMRMHVPKTLLQQVPAAIGLEVLSQKFQVCNEETQWRSSSSQH